MILVLFVRWKSIWHQIQHQKLLFEINGKIDQESVHDDKGTLYGHKNGNLGGGGNLTLPGTEKIWKRWKDGGLLNVFDEVIKCRVDNQIIQIHVKKSPSPRREMTGIDDCPFFVKLATVKSKSDESSSQGSNSNHPVSSLKSHLGKYQSPI